MAFSDLIQQSGDFTKEELSAMIGATGANQILLHQRANNLAVKHCGNEVFLRGLIEFSNICRKDCYYCGIRKSNEHTQRYNLNDETILKTARFAHENNLGSIVLQAGERNDPSFVDRIDALLQRIKKATNGELGITLSLGEQSRATYQRWFNSGAHRYLLRIETSNRELYEQLHPRNKTHDFETRIEALNDLKATGYQCGSGVMIGLPGQTVEHLAADLLFLKELDVDMVGMGPYIVHEQTPLAAQASYLWPIQQRFSTALNMIAALRLLMPDINIAASTALQAIDPMGREKALKTGANIIMPNI
ncbi:MAG: [FeFe] hydrogenase H-cluster radical SAM maturase HydE, partial [Bacteroidales bacterium]|nr:[FeFe] hydrogenase H-cluster radical SAM maturase HydE [Bacteroidales bacterium]